MKTRNKAFAGGAVGLIAVGLMYLGNLFNGLGFGTGSGPGGTGEKTDPSKIVSSATEPETRPVSKITPPGVELGKVVVVLIDGEQYKVLKSPEVDSFDAANYRPADLERIVKMAQAVEGDAGIKVRVGMRANSTPKSETDLREALLNADLPTTAILELDDTIP